MFLCFYLKAKIKKKTFSNIKYIGHVSDLTYHVGCADHQEGKVKGLGEGRLDSTALPCFSSFTCKLLRVTYAWLSGFKKYTVKF